MRVHIGGDHAAYDLKLHLVQHLLAHGHDWSTTGRPLRPRGRLPRGRPALRRGRLRAPGQLGIVLGGSGNGEQIAANKVRGIRAALAWSEETAQLCRLHNNAQIVSIGARMTEPDLATKIVDTFLSTHFTEEPRHQRRVEMLERYEATGELPPIPESEG